MQAGSTPFSSAHPPYHPYTALPGPQDHELKKQYLTLLPPPQIIEICLTFDIHVPQYVRGAIWPPDFNAAIASLQKSSPPTSEPTPAEVPSQLNEPPAMGSLTDSQGASSSSTPPDKDKSEPPEKDSSNSQSGQTNGQAAQTPYPNQYVHPQPAYPHTPYYSHPGYPLYPPGPYPAYPQVVYPQHPSSFPPQQNPLFTNAPLTHAPQHPTQPPESFNQHMSTDELPSYEEMIAEALNDCGDPDGSMPKDLFMWMASRYPLQSNFRPSASQALQKAYKRGRFQKSSGGKYKLNATWEGGNTSRRTTRRPQTQIPSAPPGAPNAPLASPFTHAPLVNHQQPPSVPPGQAPSHPFQNPPYNAPYGHSQPPGYLQPQQPTQAQPPSSIPGDSERPSPPEGDASDAYEAAQNILKAINFGGLLKLSTEDDKAAEKPSATDSSINSSMSGVASTSASHTLSIASVANGESPDVTDISDGNPRAALQAQLALLAAQLAELAQTENDEVMPVHNPHQNLSGPPPGENPPEPVIDPVLTNPPPVMNEVPVQKPVEEEEEDSNDDDMEEVTY